MRLLGVAAIVVVTVIVLQLIAHLSEEQCPAYAAFEETVAVLDRCMESLHNANDINAVLRQWGRDGWNGGGATEIDMLPGGGKERLVIFYPDVQGPQGRLVIFQQTPFWHVVYDAASIDFLGEGMNPHTNWTDWEYTVLAINHDTNSGLDDVLIGTSFTTIHRTFGYVVILTGRSQTPSVVIHVAFSEEKNQISGTYRFDQGNLVITRTIGVLGRNVDERRFTFDGNVYSLTGEVIDPPTAAIQLAQDIAIRPSDPEVLGRASSLLMSSASSLPINYPDETVILDLVKFKIFQRWLLYPPSPTAPDTVRVLYDHDDLFSPDSFEAELATIFKDTWDTTHDSQRACQVMAAFADSHPSKGLDLIRRASRGILNLKGTDLCWVTDSTF